MIFLSILMFLLIFMNQIICISDHGVKGLFPSINLVPNKNIKMSSFKSSENIQKKEGGPSLLL